jgi:hypothetical protein
MGDALEAAQREVPFPALHATHVGPVHPEHVGEALLREAPSEAVGPQVPAQTALQVPFHRENRAKTLLNDLQTKR